MKITDFDTHYYNCSPPQAQLELDLKDKKTYVSHVDFRQYTTIGGEEKIAFMYSSKAMKHADSVKDDTFLVPPELLTPPAIRGGFIPTEPRGINWVDKMARLK